MKKTLLLIIIMIVAVALPVLYKSFLHKPVEPLPKAWHTIEKTENRDYFVFVIDHSMSIKETEMQKVINAFRELVYEMQTEASASIVIFGSIVENIMEMTSDQNALSERLKGIRPDGLSAFNDGIAKALQILSRHNGRRNIIFFTDGFDDSSSFTIDQVEKMAVAMGVKVFGTAVGEINRKRLMGFSNSTGGFFGTTKRYKNLTKVLPYIMSSYYKSLKGPDNDKGDIIVRSFPDNRPVYIDEKRQGLTPLRIPGLKTGNHIIRVDFDKNVSTGYTVPVEPGSRTTVEVRGTGAGRNILLASLPEKGAAFIDGVYIGLTGKFNHEFRRDNWNFAIKSSSDVLVAGNIPFGEHILTFPCDPGFNSGIGLDLRTRASFRLKSSAEDAIIVTNLFGKEVTRTNLKTVSRLTEQ